MSERMSCVAEELVLRMNNVTVPGLAAPNVPTGSVYSADLGQVVDPKTPEFRENGQALHNTPTTTGRSVDG